MQTNLRAYNHPHKQTNKQTNKLTDTQTCLTGTNKNTHMPAGGHARTNEWIHKQTLGYSITPHKQTNKQTNSQVDIQTNLQAHKHASQAQTRHSNKLTGIQTHLIGTNKHARK